MAITRFTLDYTFGQLDSGVAISDTSLSSPDFGPLPAFVSEDIVVPLVLSDPAEKVYEVVWVTGHQAGSATITVRRGRENTEAKPWPGATLWELAPTTRDGLTVGNKADLPGDLHLGARAVALDEQLVYEQTEAQGLVAGLVANPDDVQKLPAGRRAMVKVFRQTRTTDDNAQAQFDFPGGGFPHGVVTAFAQISTGSTFKTQSLVVESYSRTYVRYSVYRGSDGTAMIGTTVAAWVLALGY